MAECSGDLKTGAIAPRFGQRQPAGTQRGTLDRDLPLRCDEHQSIRASLDPSDLLAKTAFHAQPFAFGQERFQDRPS